MLENAVADQGPVSGQWPLWRGLLPTATTAALAQQLLRVPVETLMMQVVKEVSGIVQDLPRYDRGYMDTYLHSLDAKAQQ